MRGPDVRRRPARRGCRPASAGRPPAAEGNSREAGPCPAGARAGCRRSGRASDSLNFTRRCGGNRKLLANSWAGPLAAPELLPLLGFHPRSLGAANHVPETGPREGFGKLSAAPTALRSDEVHAALKVLAVHRIHTSQAPPRSIFPLHCLPWIVPRGFGVLCFQTASGRPRVHAEI